MACCRLLDDAAVNKMVHWNFPLPMTPMVKLGMLLNGHQLRGAFGEWNRADYPVLDQVCPASQGLHMNTYSICTPCCSVPASHCVYVSHSISYSHCLLLGTPHTVSFFRCLTQFVRLLCTRLTWTTSSAIYLSCLRRPRNNTESGDVQFPKARSRRY